MKINLKLIIAFFALLLLLVSLFVNWKELKQGFVAGYRNASTTTTRNDSL